MITRWCWTVKHRWRVSRENRSQGLCRCHTKRRVAAPILLLVWHRIFRVWLCWHYGLYSRKVCVMRKKDGRGHSHPSFFWYDNDKDLNMLKVFFSHDTSQLRVLTISYMPSRTLSSSPYYYYRHQPPVQVVMVIFE